MRVRARHRPRTPSKQREVIDHRKLDFGEPANSQRRQIVICSQYRRVDPCIRQRLAMARRRTQGDLELARRLVQRELHGISSKIPRERKDHEKHAGKALWPHSGFLRSEYQWLPQHYSLVFHDRQRSQRADVRFRRNVARLSPVLMRYIIQPRCQLALVFPPAVFRSTPKVRALCSAGITQPRG
jgi:hypothetical protein